MKRNVEDLHNKIKELLEELDGIDFKKMKNKIDERLQNAIDEPCIISIDKKQGGEASIIVKGDRLSLLVTLAGLEKQVLEKLECNNSEWEFIKNKIGTRED